MHRTLVSRLDILEAENKALREAAQAVVDRYPSFASYTTNPVHALAALTKEES